MKKALAILAVALATSANAELSVNTVGQAGFDKLSAQDQAQIVQMVAAKAKTAAESSTTVPSAEKVNQWVDVGKNIGSGLAGAAKEVGVAVNDFATTPVGILTTMLIVWHMIGSTLIHLFGGIAFWIVGFTVLRFLVKHTYPTTVEYDLEKRTIFGRHPIKKIGKPDEWSSEFTFMVWLTGMAILCAGMGIIVTG